MPASLAGMLENVVDFLFKARWEAIGKVDRIIKDLELKIRKLDSFNSDDNARRYYFLLRMRTRIAGSESIIAAIKDIVDKECTREVRAKFQPKYERIRTLTREIKKRIGRSLRAEAKNFNPKIHVSLKPMIQQAEIHDTCRGLRDILVIVDHSPSPHAAAPCQILQRVP